MTLHQTNHFCNFRNFQCNLSSTVCVCGSALKSTVLTHTKMASRRIMSIEHSEVIWKMNGNNSGMKFDIFIVLLYYYIVWHYIIYFRHVFPSRFGKRPKSDEMVSMARCCYRVCAKKWKGQHKWESQYPKVGERD